MNTMYKYETEANTVTKTNSFFYFLWKNSTKMKEKTNNKKTFNQTEVCLPFSHMYPVHPAAQPPPH